MLDLIDVDRSSVSRDRLPRARRGRGDGRRPATRGRPPPRSGAESCGAPHSASGAAPCASISSHASRIEPGERHLLGDQRGDDTGPRTTCRRPSALPFRIGRPFSNATPVTWTVGSATPGAHTSTQSPWFENSAFGPVRVGDDHGSPFGVDGGVERSDTEHRVERRRVRSRGSCPVARRGDDDEPVRLRCGSNRSVTSTTALRPTGSSCAPGWLVIEVAGHGAERVDDHRRPVLPRHVAQRCRHPSGGRHVGGEAGPVGHARFLHDRARARSSRSRRRSPFRDPQVGSRR